MKKRQRVDAILEKAARMVVEEDFRKQNEKARKYPHTVSLDFQLKMNRLFARADTFTVHNQSKIAKEDNPFFKQLDNKENNPSSLWIYRRYIAVMALLMLGVLKDEN